MVVADYNQVVHKEEHCMEVGYMVEDCFNLIEEDMEVEHYKVVVEEILVEMNIYSHYILNWVLDMLFDFVKNCFLNSFFYIIKN